MIVGLKLVALLTMTLVTACGQISPVAQPILLRSDELGRDLATFDQVAADAGFIVNKSNYRDQYATRRLVFLRYYRKPSRCCFSMGLAKREQEPTLELWVYDSRGDVKDSREFRPPECAMYAHFREALIAKLGTARILHDKPIC